MPPWPAPCSAAAAATAAAAAPNFPYTAYVTAENVYVRSGPGDNYYPTDKLKAGDKVEVYRHDPGGWLAIRPVPGSFSWVAGRYLQLGNKNIATVTEERVAARVGSRFSDVRDCVQVRLHRGEAVEVLDAPRDGAAAGGGQSVVQDCPAGGRIPLDLQPLRRHRISLATACGRHRGDDRRRAGKSSRPRSSIRRG